MQNLIDDNTISAPAKPQTVDDLLAGYKTPLSISPTTQNSGQSSQGINPSLSKPITSVIEQAEQKFYKTGAKAGQPKPNRGVSQPVRPVAGSAPVPGAPIQNQLISGALFITLIDLLLPLLISVINNQFSKKKIDASKLKLNDQQKKDVEPLCNEVVKQLNINANPALLLTVSLGGMYAMNFMLMKAMTPEVKSTNPYDK